jgi:hypothetical protein
MLSAPAQARLPQIAPHLPVAMPALTRRRLLTSAAANGQQIGMHIMPPRHFDNAGSRRQALFNDPALLSRRPSPPSLWTR